MRKFKLEEFIDGVVYRDIETGLEFKRERDQLLYADGMLEWKKVNLIFNYLYREFTIKSEIDWSKVPRGIEVEATDYLNSTWYTGLFMYNEYDYIKDEACTSAYNFHIVTENGAEEYSYCRIKGEIKKEWLKGGC